MMQTSLSAVNGTQAHPNWLHQTVQQFLQQINWEDQPPEVQVLRQPTIEGKDQPLSLLLTVNQFFSAIPWDGDPAAISPGPIAEPLSTDEEENSFTLDDFSGLF